MSFLDRLQIDAIRLLRWSEKYTKTDMVYLAHGGFWLVLGQVGAVLLTLALAVAFGHLASQDTYGNYKYVLSLAGIFTAFSLSGIGTAVTQATARGFEGSLTQGAKLALKWSWGLVLLSLCVGLYYYVFEHNVFLGVSLIIVAVFLPVMNSFSLFGSFLVGKKEFAQNTTYGFLNLLFPTVALVAALFFSHRAIIFVLVYFTANAIADLACHLFALRRAKNDSTDPGTFSYGAHLSVMGVINALGDKIDSIIVFAFLGPAPLAVYSYAIAMPEQIKAVAKSIGTLSMPKFAARPIGDIKRNIWGRLTNLTLVFALFIFLYILAAPYLFRFLFPVYTDSIGYSQLYALSILVTGISSTLVSVLQAHKKTKALYLSSNTGSLALIVLLFVFVPLWGITGAILAQIGYRLVTAGVTVWQFILAKD